MKVSMTVNQFDVKYQLSQVDQSDRRKAVHLDYLQASLRCATLNVSADVANSNSPLGLFP
jgi:hypothetical protein